MTGILIVLTVWTAANLSHAVNCAEVANAPPFAREIFEVVKQKEDPLLQFIEVLDSQIECTLEWEANKNTDGIESQTTSVTVSFKNHATYFYQVINSVVITVQAHARFGEIRTDDFNVDEVILRAGRYNSKECTLNLSAPEKQGLVEFYRCPGDLNMSVVVEKSPGGGVLSIGRNITE